MGQWAEEGHRQVGEYAKDKVSALYAVGSNMAHAVAAFGTNARHFANQADLIDAVRAAEQATNTTILIKGSRSAAMENVVAALCGSSGEKH
ncbi:UDP-N-acetylmuramoyl-tripeptide--D-alanyl-D-alanine ligase [compost metagenome]